MRISNSRRRFIRLLPFICLVVLFLGCEQQESPSYISFQGETMGTYYHITAFTDNDKLQSNIDSVLTVFEKIFSTYDPGSDISGLNNSTDADYCLIDQKGHFSKVLSISKEAFSNTNGSFDPTIMPLVRYWGFSSEKFKRKDYDLADIDSLREKVGFDLISWVPGEDGKLCFERTVPGMSLDLSAVAKGYGVDVVSDFFEDIGITDFMIEIGGEIVARGKNERGSWWKIGIEKPISSSDISKREQHAVVALKDMAIASSGNYRNFYELNGRLIGHTINPASGMPEQNDLMAVSVTAGQCAYADALATGFMVLGYTDSRMIADSLPGVEALFIRLDSIENTIVTDMTDGFRQYIEGSN